MLDPNNAFTLNNMGYIAEIEGDRETASYFYAKALEAHQSNVRVATATRKEVEGQKLGVVANINDQAVDAAERTQQELRRRQGAPPALLRRDNTPVVDTAPPARQKRLGLHRLRPAKASQTQSEPLENGPVQKYAAVTRLRAAGRYRPGDANGPIQGVIPPLPDSQQPAGAR